jgi:UPF0755 protein
MQQPRCSSCRHISTGGSVLNRRQRARGILVIASIACTACTGEGTGPLVRVHISRGARMTQVADSLKAKGLIRSKTVFRLLARITNAGASVKPGTYQFHRGVGEQTILADLRAGNFLKTKVVIPEGWTLKRIAPRIAPVTGGDADSILAILTDTTTAQRFKVPGPTLEGYLYPATHVFPVDLPLDSVLVRLIAPYRRVWTTARKAAADSAGMSERQVVTLASIVEAEAKKRDEMPQISAVYHNRLKANMPLQADPTVQYALPTRRERLMYEDIQSIAANEYNTYTHQGLPPGPIGSPSAAAIDAVLHPAAVDYYYFVSKPDGSSVFTRSLAEHNRAKEAIRKMTPDTPTAPEAAAPPASPKPTNTSQ